MDFASILVILIVVYLRKSLKTAVAFPEWHKRFFSALIAASVFLLLQNVKLPFLSAIAGWAGFFLLCGLLYIIYSNEKFATARFLLIAVLPYMIITALLELVRLISKTYYDKWEDWLGTISGFAFLWGIGVWIVTSRQRKDLQKAQQNALDEQEKSRFMAIMKDELEVQVAERTATITKQKEELESTLSELQATQAQLIQSEKMASLGELTAGIAHEIQNPLNFVNNFSDVNNELLEEMLAEIQNNNAEEVKAIAADIKDNNSKIISHGKRADAIVKSMLQHSRKNTGQKEPTGMNDLCDEYLRLSYHGLRAKDKSFNADFKTFFDESIPKLNIVPQDVGRVLLNLFNNAFYAVNEKRKNLSGLQELSGFNNYKPLVTVTTTSALAAGGENAVKIIITDNGNGIPQNIQDKIFQPFFTTKPTGQGTGLGLSLSYEIIEAHNGEIKAESKEGEGTTFTILLPV